MTTTIARILDRKGHDVVTVTPEATLEEVVTALTERQIGAVVVVDDGGVVRGIVSERDVVHALADARGDALAERAADVMTTEITTVTPERTTDELAATMTTRRIRHLPVVVDDQLVGIVSIGDVVKWNLDELRTRAEQLTEYVSGGY